MLTSCAIGPLYISPVAEPERRWVLDSWMRGTMWPRSRIVRAMEAGQVLVARDGDEPDAFSYGWMCTVDGAIAHAAVKRDFRELGVARELWKASGEPQTLLEPATRRGKRVMRKLRGDRE